MLFSIFLAASRDFDDTASAKDAMRAVQSARAGLEAATRESAMAANACRARNIPDLIAIDP